METKTDQELIQRLWTRLAETIDPTTGKDIVSQKMVLDLVVKDGLVLVTLTVDAAKAATLESMRKSLERKLLSEPKVLSATVVLTAEKSGEKSGENAAAKPPNSQPHSHSVRPNLAPGIKRMIAVASGKGGVGKSTTAVNLALALAGLGQRVGLLDADVYGPSTPRLMGLSGKPQVKEGKLQPLMNYGIACMSMGFLVPEETAMVWRGPMVAGALEQMLRDVNWGELDILVIDMPPGTGDAQLTLAQRVALAGAVIVSTPQDIALLDARKAVAMFQKVQVPILGIIENMSYFICPDCGARSEIFSHGGARHDAERLQVPFLGEVPLTLELRETSDRGIPIVTAAPESVEARAFIACAEAVLLGLLSHNQTAAPTIVME